MKNPKERPRRHRGRRESFLHDARNEKKPSFLGKSMEDLLLHDLANYMQGTMGYLELVLKKGGLEEWQQRYLTKALSQAEKLSKLLTAASMIRNIQSHKPDPKPLDVCSLLHERDIECVGEETIVADENLLDAIDNVLDVYAGFGEQPAVEISQDRDRYTLTFRCARSISENDALALQYFTRFKSEHAPIGIGLSIAKAIVESSGGRLIVQPSPLTVSLVIPIIQPSHGA